MEKSRQFFLFVVFIFCGSIPLFPSGAFAAVQIVASANNNGGTSSPQTMSFTTVSGANSILIVTMQGGVSDASVTWNGTPLTKGPAIEGVNGNNAGAIIFYLLNPAVGTYNIVVTFLSPWGGCHIGAIQATGVAQQAPEASQTASTVWGNSLTTPACSHSAGALVVTNGNSSAASAFSSLGIVGGGDTQLFNKDTATSGGRVAGSTYIIPPSSGTKQANYQHGSNGTMAAAIASFAPVTLDHYWIGNIGDSFNDATKWSTTAGGSNNVSEAPGATNIVHFTTGTGASLTGDINVEGMVLASGFTGTVTLNGNVSVTGTLTVAAGTLDVGAHTLSNTPAGAAAAISGGTLQVGTGTASFTSGITMSSGTLSLTSTGTLSLGSGSTTTISGGSFTSSAGSIANLRCIGPACNYGFSMTGGTIDIDGMLIRHTNLDGINIGNGVTITRIANVEFSNGITTSGSKYLTITKNALNMFMEGLKFDTATTYNVHLVGNGDSDGTTRLTIQYMDATTNGSGAGEARDQDNDSGGNGLANDPNTDGAVIQWVTYYTDITGDSIIGFPTPAFDWNTFEYYGTYVAIKDANGTADRIYVRGGDGASQGFSWDGPSGEDFIGAPRWIQEGNDRIVFVITTGGKVYKLRNTGAALQLVTNWPYTTAYTPTTSLGIGNNYLVWAANSSGSNRYIQRLDHTAANPNTMGAADYQYSSDGSPVDAMTANPALSVISNTLYAFFAGKDRVYRLDAESWSAAVDSTTAAATQPNGRLGVFFSRVYFGDNEGRVFVKDAANSSLPTLWSYQGTAPGGGGCSSATCRFVNLTVGFNLPDAATYPRVYWGDISGRLFAVRQNGTGGTLITGFPMELATGAGSTISAAPLYFGGVVVVGTEGGDLFVVNQRTTAEGVPAVVQRYSVGGSISSVSRDATNARYIAVAQGRLFYYPLCIDCGAVLPTKLAIVTQPVGGVTGAQLATQPVIELLDADNNRAPSTANVTVSLFSGAGGTLGGTVTIAAVNGVATFTDLTLAGVVGTNYVLRFSSGALSTVDSDAMTIPIAYEGFDSADGYTELGNVDTRNGGTGWNGPWVDIDGGSGAEARTSSALGGGLAYSGLPTGGVYKMDSQVQDIRRSLSATPFGTPGDELWVSYLVSVHFFGTHTFHLTSNNHTVNALTMTALNRGTYTLSNGTATADTGVAVGAEAGIVRLVVVKVEFASGNDIARMWVGTNLDISSEAALGPAMATVDNTDFQVDGVKIAGGYGGFYTDEIRIATTYASLIPAQ